MESIFSRKKNTCKWYKTCLSLLRRLKSMLSAVSHEPEHSFYLVMCEWEAHHRLPQMFAHRSIHPQVEESRSHYSLSGQSSLLKIQRSGCDSRRYQIFCEVVFVERGPLSLVSTTEELLRRKSSGPGLQSRTYGYRYPSCWPRDTPHWCDACFTITRVMFSCSVFFLRRQCFLKYAMVYYSNNKTNSMVWVREQTIPSERPLLVIEAIANFCR
jgi:hypothetical protein